MYAGVSWKGFLVCPQLCSLTSIKIFMRIPWQLQTDNPKQQKINKATTTTTLSDADTQEMTAKKDQNMTIKIRTLKSDRLAGRPYPHPRPRPCPRTRTRLRFCFCLFFFFILFFDLTLHLSLGPSRVPVLTPQV